VDLRLGHESSEATRVTRHELPVCTSITEQPQRTSIPRGEHVDEMIYVLPPVVCHRVHSGGANCDVQQRWQQYLLVEAERSDATARATLSRRRVASRTLCPGVQKRVSSLDYRCDPVRGMSYTGPTFHVVSQVVACSKFLSFYHCTESIALLCFPRGDVLKPPSTSYTGLTLSGPRILLDTTPNTTQSKRTVCRGTLSA
jgi:hypothetical protein